MAEVIAVLEDDKRRTEAMKKALDARFPLLGSLFFDNAPDTVAWLKDNLSGVRLICLDHDLGASRERDGKPFDPGTGREVSDFLVTRHPSCPVLIHSTNTEAANGMLLALEEAGWRAERLSPFDDLAWVEALWSARVASLLE
jgi:hypothetical protein